MKVRDAILRTFPEVWQVVGKAGRAETATDPSRLDMVETVINLRDRELWPKRKLKFEDALAQTGAVLSAMESRGILRSDPSSDRRTLINESAMEVETRVDVALRDLAMLRLVEFRPELGRALVGDALDDLLRRLRPPRCRSLPHGGRANGIGGVTRGNAWRPPRSGTTFRRCLGPGSRRRSQARQGGSTP